MSIDCEVSLFFAAFQSGSVDAVQTVARTEPWVDADADVDAYATLLTFS